MTKMKYTKAQDLNIDIGQHKTHGCDYTPRELSIRLAKLLKWDGVSDIIDPCCGSGNLMKACIEVYGDSIRSHLFGVDILEENIEYCKNDPQLYGCTFRQGDCLNDPIFKKWWWEGKTRNKKLF